MKDMSKAGKQLKTDLAVADDTKHDKATDLKSVATMKENALKSHDLIPKKEQSLPPDQQAAMTADFKATMDDFVKDVDTLNTDITADKWDAARNDYQKLMDDEKAGHKKFRIQKGDKPGAAPAPAPRLLQQPLRRPTRRRSRSLSTRQVNADVIGGSACSEVTGRSHFLRRRDTLISSSASPCENSSPLDYLSERL